MMKKKLFLIIISALFSCSNENKKNNNVENGRTLYKSYFNQILKDPNSLIIYKEDVLEKKDTTFFEVDYGAKNSFGGMIRKTSLFMTVKDFNDVVSVDGMDYVFGLGITGETKMNNKKTPEDPISIDYSIKTDSAKIK